MEARIKHLADKMALAVGPLFHEHQTYDDILMATCILTARVIQSTPDAGNEQAIFEGATKSIQHILNELLRIEQEAKAASKAKLDAGIVLFSQFAGQEATNGKNLECPNEKLNQE